MSESWEKFGPNGAQVEAFLERLKVLSEDEITKAQVAGWVAVFEAAFDVAWAARDATRGEDWDDVYEAGRAAYFATMALLVKHLISGEHFNVLTAPFKEIIAEFTEVSRE